MKLFVANWPNGTISIISAHNQRDLVESLDLEGNPEEAKLTEVSLPHGKIHLTTMASGKISWDVNNEVTDSDKQPVSLWNTFQ
jgi:hypothetical protein